MLPSMVTKSAPESWRIEVAELPEITVDATVGFTVSVFTLLE
jgi:hypothetical protein